ncbi:unnamed protein product [Linum trigynum]|uniref:Uncharacterized protein n=1 Tax=Linum trigynum TaxID=586398 RepID=A0AAV2D8Y5_9ROSI
MFVIRVLWNLKRRMAKPRFQGLEYYEPSVAHIIHDWEEVGKIRQQRGEQMAQMQEQQLAYQQKQIGMETGAGESGRRSDDGEDEVGHEGEHL